MSPVTTLDLAEITVSTQIEAALTVARYRLDDPDAFPGYPDNVSPDAIARRIIGALLNLGWTMPEAPAP